MPVLRGISMRRPPEFGEIVAEQVQPYMHHRCGVYSVEILRFAQDDSRIPGAR
jgi:hypothetical protein